MASSVSCGSTTSGTPGWSSRGDVSPAPAEVVERSRGFAYGCDLCQEACPQNKAPGAVSPIFGAAGLRE